MILRTLQEAGSTGTSVDADTWTSRRLLLADDGMGFSLHDTIMRAGTTTPMWYRNHVEAVYCIHGEGELRETDTGAVHQIGPGTLYALDAHDRHSVHARTDLRLICVFNPPCTGQERHDEDGSYPLLMAHDEGGSDGA